MNALQRQLPPLGAEVEELLSFAQELKDRFNNPSEGNFFLLSVAAIEEVAKRIMLSLPLRKQLARARPTPAYLPS